MKQMWKKGLLLMAVLLCGLFALVACGQQDEETGTSCQVYCVSNSETKVESHEYIIQADTQEEQLKELLEYLSTMPERLEYKPPLTMGFSLKDYTLENGKLMLDVDAGYKELKPTTEVLVRAAIVYTLTQLDGVNLVGITIEGSPLADSLGNPVGMMTAEQFINNEGSEINTIETAHLKLYFANATGDGLIAVNRTQNYNSNVPLEKLVVQEIIAGPDPELSDTVFPVVNPNTKVLGTTVTDGVCYVNLDDSFLNQTYNVTADVTIYAMVNSLIELSNVNKVQISINGDTTGVYREKYSFTTIFDRNLDIIAVEEQ